MSHQQLLEKIEEICLITKKLFPSYGKLSTFDWGVVFHESSYIITCPEYSNKGDAGGGYLLTTAENSLGVVIAKSEAGSLMVPVSWTEMQCTSSYSVEERKVAKVIPEHLAKLTK